MLEFQDEALAEATGASREQIVADAVHRFRLQEREHGFPAGHYCTGGDCAACREDLDNLFQSLRGKAARRRGLQITG
ncbi:hypothetical protein CU254_42015 (plasmid) [Amycolatopsis sp. AA4]|uniref:hypothetical protein n=1 Tax=Actinomycetes TaxID=1760 RepID=UPI0001B56C13|nr:MULTISPECIES: hypothetical protein [Actinomycetes]ATY17156.1 hypothetical protein CU254_42015 [Amycolatopsis sp. AA4]EFL12614.1 predicted protein [Streptomyces sp. AA4]